MSLTTLEDGELILELEVPTPAASSYLKAMDRKRWAFRSSASRPRATTTASGSRSPGWRPIPWALDSARRARRRRRSPVRAYKVDVARAWSGGAGIAAPVRSACVLVLAAAALFGGLRRRGRDTRRPAAPRVGAVATAPGAAAPRAEPSAAESADELAPTSETHTALVARTAATSRSRSTPRRRRDVASFVALAEDGYFDETVFHRIVPGFVIQGGDLTATGTGGLGYSTVDTPAGGHDVHEGRRRDGEGGERAAGTAGSQFFVVTAERGACRRTTR